MVVDYPTVPPDLSPLLRLQLPHFNHPLDEGSEESSLIPAEPFNHLLRRRLAAGEERLVGVQEPPQLHQILEVLVVEGRGSGVEPAGDVAVAAQGTQRVELLAVGGIHGGVGPAGAGLVVEPEDDGEAAAFADGVRARERDQVDDGEVEAGEEADEGGGVGPGAGHDLVRRLLAGGQAVLPAEPHFPLRPSALQLIHRFPNQPTDTKKTNLQLPGRRRLWRR